MYTVRVPFRLVEGKKLGRIEEAHEEELEGLRLRLEERAPYYELVILGLSSEDHARQFVSRSLAGLFWAMLRESLPFKAKEEPRDVYYPDDPKRAAQNVFGTDAESIEGVIDGQSPAFYPSALRIVVVTAGDLSVEVGMPAPRVLSSIREGVARVREDALHDGKLRIALELYRSHFFERSAEAKLITLVMALEALAPSTLKHPIALDLLAGWQEQLSDRQAGLARGSDEYIALEALERELLRRREASLRSQVRMLVRGALDGAGFTDGEARARRAVEVYDVRSTLVHEGRVDPTKLREALRDAQDLARDVLQLAMLPSV